MLVVGPNQNQFYLLSPKKKKKKKNSNNLSLKICYKYYERNITRTFIEPKLLRFSSYGIHFFKGRQEQLVM